MATKILKKQLPWDRTICTQLEMVDLSGNSYVCNAIEQMHENVQIVSISNKIYAEIYGDRVYLCNTKINIVKSWFYEHHNIQIHGI
jgi:hypothetical protein